MITKIKTPKANFVKFALGEQSIHVPINQRKDRLHGNIKRLILGGEVVVNI